VDRELRDPVGFEFRPNSGTTRRLLARGQLPQQVTGLPVLPYFALSERRARPACGDVVRVP